MAITSASQQEQNGIVSQMDDTCFFSKIYHAVVSLRFDLRIVEMWAMWMRIRSGGDSDSRDRWRRFEIISTNGIHCTSALGTKVGSIGWRVWTEV